MAKFTYFYGTQPFSFDMLVVPDEEVEYTEQDILDQLRFRYGTNEIKFRYDLLNYRERRLKTLDSVVSAEISMAAFAQIKRTAKFELEEDEEIDWLNDKIQPFILLKMPNGMWVEWSLGIFVLSSPERVERAGRVYRSVEAYDGLVVLKDDKLTERYTIKEGTNYISAVYEILRSAGVEKINIERTQEELNTTREIEVGTEKLKVVNDLLNEINWNTLWVDEDGYYTSSRYTSPANRSATQDYYDDELSILNRGMSEELDLFDIANTWSVVVSNPEVEPLTASYVNDNPDSPTSTINRGRAIVDFREIDNIANQDALDARVERYAFNASQVYGYLKFETALNPLHSYSDVLNIRNEQMGIEGKYGETHWTMPLKAGALMSHEVRKVVNI